jgi:hypothetical protein
MAGPTPGHSEMHSYFIDYFGRAALEFATTDFGWRLKCVESPPSDDLRKLLLQAIGRGWTMIDGGYADAFRTNAHNIAPTTRSRKPSQKS